MATVGKVVQRRERPHPNTYLGPGKVEEVKEEIRHADANLVAVDDELYPARSATSSRRWACRSSTAPR